MRRRAFLGALAGGLTAGCPEWVGTDNSSTVTPVPVPPASCRTDPAARTTTDEPRLTAGRERYLDLSCPDIDGVERTVCSQTDDAGGEPVVLAARDHLADLIADLGGTVTFDLANRSGAPLVVRTADWSVLRPVVGADSLAGHDGSRRSPPSDIPDAAGPPDLAPAASGWEPAARGRASCLRVVTDGGRHRSRLGVERTPAGIDRPGVAGARVDLDPGTYAFVARVSVRGGPTVAVLAPFTVRRIVGATGIEGGDGSATNTTRTPAGGTAVATGSGTPTRTGSGHVVGTGSGTGSTQSATRTQKP